MTNKEEDEGIINSSPALDKQSAAMDIRIKDRDTYDRWPDLFDDPEHLEKIEKVLNLIETFYGKDVTVRRNRRPYVPPATIIKVEDANPIGFSKEELKEKYFSVLKSIGVTVGYAPSTNSHLHKIPTNLAMYESYDYTHEKKKKTKIKKEVFDIEVIRQLDSMPFEEAFRVASEMVEISNMKPEKKVRFMQSLSKATSAKRVSEAMWQAYLAGEGNSSLASNWDRRNGR